jgi:hypothetical protein
VEAKGTPEVRALISKLRAERKNAEFVEAAEAFRPGRARAAGADEALSGAGQDAEGRGEAGDA